MAINKILKLYKKKIELRLRNFLDEKIAESEKISDSSREIMQYIKEFNLRGGKRIRSILEVPLDVNDKNSFMIDNTLSKFKIKHNICCHCKLNNFPPCN